MLLVGLTGGIGSGKSSVAARLAELGAVVIDADVIAREVVEPPSPVLDALSARFGSDILDEHGRLRREVLAARAFADEPSRAALNAITHPQIRQRLDERIREHADEDIVVVDHPLLIETGQVNAFDELVVVLAPAELRELRLVDERSMSVADVRARMQTQVDDDARREAASYVVTNDGSREALTHAVNELMVWLRGRASATR
ncbi:MAG: dephospho-CoA kinase [Nitriliruptoraceae bacterium]